MEGHLSSLPRLRQDQRLTQTAIVENKRLDHALSLVKAQQDIKRETKVLNNSEKTGYQKRPRPIYGPDFVEMPLATVPTPPSN